MLDPWIIEEIRRREREKDAQRIDHRPALDIPEAPPAPGAPRPDGGRRGVVIVKVL